MEPVVGLLACLHLVQAIAPPRASDNAVGYSRIVVATPGMRHYTYDIAHDRSGSDFNINFSPVDTELDSDNFLPQPEERYTPHAADYDTPYPDSEDDQVTLNVKHPTHEEMEKSSKEIQSVHEAYSKKPPQPQHDDMLEDFDLGIMGYGDFMDPGDEPRHEDPVKYAPSPEPLKDFAPTPESPFGPDYGFKKPSTAARPKVPYRSTYTAHSDTPYNPEKWFDPKPNPQKGLVEKYKIPPVRYGTPLEKVKFPPVRYGTPLEKDKIPLVHYTTPLEKVKVPPVRYGTPLEKDKIPLVHYATPLEKVKVSPVRYGTPLEKDKFPLVHYTTPLQKVKVPPLHYATPLEQVKIPPVHYAPSLGNVEISPFHYAPPLNFERALFIPAPADDKRLSDMADKAYSKVFMAHGFSKPVARFYPRHKEHEGIDVAKTLFVPVVIVPTAQQSLAETQNIDRTTSVDFEPRKIIKKRE